MKIQAGTIGDYPPILREDLLACHMANLAAGLKDGSLGVFVLNLQSSPQETVVRAPGGPRRRFVLKAMEVGYGVL